MSRRIGIAGLIWGMSILLSRVIGIVREAVIGRTLGGGSSADVYWAAFIVPDFLNHILAGGALSIVFIPIFGSYLAKAQEDKGWEAFSVIATFVTTVLAVLMAALFVLLPRLTPVVAPGFDAAQRAYLVYLSRIILPAQFFHIVGGLLAAVLLAKDRHTLPAIAPLLYTTGVVVGGLAGGSTAGAEGFAWGVLAGSFIGPFALPLIGCVKEGLRWKPLWRPRHPDLITYLLRSLPVMLSWSIIVVDDWFLRREGSLLGVGVVSIVTYAKTLMRVPMGVFGLAAGQAVFPTLARLAGQGKHGEMYRTVVSTTRVTLTLAFAAQVVLTVAGYDIAAVIYGRQRLSEPQLVDIGRCLALVSIGLGAWAAHPVISRGFYSMGNTWIPAVLGTVVSVAVYPLYILSRITVGTYGLAMMSSVAVVVYIGLLYMTLGRFVRTREPGEYPSLVPFLAGSLPAMALGIAAGFALSSSLPGAATLLGSLGRGATLAAVGVGVFLATARALGIAEVRDVQAAISRRVRGAR
ncbi:murein biosynthesis integral membrane protein MurJ [Candidatus Fermentibacteria bacterium]|nr:murein biosynthesis integral membrane protein MurJ [Candidatus Fermentibacteria bacterium]